MRYLLILFTCSCLCANAQDSSRSIEETINQMESRRVQMDSTMAVYQKRNDSIEMARFAEQNTRNLNAFMASRKEAEKKAQKQMYIRLSTGVVFLIIFIIGMRRRKKNLNSTAG